jgi:hypothetical protein
MNYSDSQKGVKTPLERLSLLAAFCLIACEWETVLGRLLYLVRILGKRGASKRSGRVPLILILLPLIPFQIFTF